MLESAISGNRYEKMNEWWEAYVDAYGQSLDNLEREINEAIEMQKICNDEWCAATEHYLDDVANALFTIHEPRWISQEQSDRLRLLKKRVHDVYYSYRSKKDKAGASA